MQKSALSGSTSSNLIAGISPHVRRFSVWAFLKTVTRALHSDFLFTTQEKHPLLTCIALSHLNYVLKRMKDYCITARRTKHAPHKRIWTPTTSRLGLIYRRPLHRHNIAPCYATAGGSMESTNVRAHEGRWPYLEIVIFILILYGLRLHYQTLPFCNRNYNMAMPGDGNIPHCAFIYIFFYLCHTQSCATQLRLLGY